MCVYIYILTYIYKEPEGIAFSIPQASAKQPAPYSRQGCKVTRYAIYGSGGIGVGESFKV